MGGAILTGMDLGVGTLVWVGDDAGTVIEGPDEGGQFLVEFQRASGDLDTVWCAPVDPRLRPRRA